MERDKELFGFGGEFLDLLFSDAQEYLKSVDFFLIDFRNNTSQNKTQQKQCYNPCHKHNNLRLHIVRNKFQYLLLSLLGSGIHGLTCDISVKFKVIDLELFYGVVDGDQVGLGGFALHAGDHVDGVVYEW